MFNKPPAVVTAQEFQVVDRFGLRRATFGMKSDINDQPVLELLHRNGKPGLRIEMDSAEVPAITLYDPDGTARINLSVSLDNDRSVSSIILSDTAGVKRIFLVVTPDDNCQIFVTDEEGRWTWVLDEHSVQTRSGVQVHEP